MFQCIPDVLSSAALTEIVETTGALEFHEGTATAGWHAREVKRNRQAKATTALRHVQRSLVQAIEANEVFAAAALPRRIAPPLIARYGPGESYGAHVDDALMRLDPPMRSDLSVTLFLCEPDSYEGGDLIIETSAGEDAVKLAAGAMVVYPSTTLHRVEPVTRGERLAAVTWVQSLVRDAARREILFDLDQVRRALFASEGKGRNFDLLAKSYANLLRGWAET